MKEAAILNDESVACELVSLHEAGMASVLGEEVWPMSLSVSVKEAWPVCLSISVKRCGLWACQSPWRRCGLCFCQSQWGRCGLCAFLSQWRRHHQIWMDRDLFRQSCHFSVSLSCWLQKIFELLKHAHTYIAKSLLHWLSIIETNNCTRTKCWWLFRISLHITEVLKGCWDKTAVKYTFYPNVLHINVNQIHRHVKSLNPHVKGLTELCK